MGDLPVYGHRTLFSKEALDDLREKGPQVVPLMYHGVHESIAIGEATVEVDEIGIRVIDARISDPRFSSALSGLLHVSIGEEKHARE